MDAGRDIVRIEFAMTKLKIGSLILSILLVAVALTAFLPQPVQAATDRYFVMGQVFIVNGAHITVAEAGRIATGGNTTLNITDDGAHGTFTLYMASGTSGTVTSGTSTITGSPVTLSAGLNTITATNTGTATLNLTIGTAANWNTVNSWSATSGGACTASVPTSADNTYFNANSFTAASQVLTVDAMANCLAMDWTGAGNTPTLTVTNELRINGSATYISAMVANGTNYLSYRTGTGNITSNGLSFGCPTIIYSGTWTLADEFIATGTVGYLYVYGATFDTGNQTVTCVRFGDNGVSFAKTITLGSSTINITGTLGWNFPSGGLTLTANTATINIAGTGAFAGGGITTYNTVNLNGTAHTVSGSNTFVNLYRNGTATKTDTLTLTAGTTQTVTGICGLIGNSAANRLLVQSSTLGTAATIHNDGAWTGTNAVDFMDITSTHAIDFSNEVTYSNFVGDCGGNTGITCTASSTQTSASTATWSTAAGWTGSGTSRVPLAQDDVNCSHSKTVDMPRIGRSITFTGTPTITKSNAISIYGSLTLASGMTWTGGFIESFRGRSNYTLTTNGLALYRLEISAPSGKLSLVGDYTYGITSYILVNNGEFDAVTYNVSGGNVQTMSGTTLTMGTGTWTISRITIANTWNIAGTVAAGTSTLIITRSDASAGTFAGGSQTYNNVRIEGSGNYALTISGNNTFNTFTVDRSSANKTLTLTASSNQTMADLVCTKSDARWLTINSTGGTAYLTKSGGGTLGFTYLDLSNNTGNPDSTWYYTPVSVIGANVNNWVLDAPPTITTVSSSLITTSSANTTGNCVSLNFGGNLNYVGCEYGTATATYTGNTTTTVDMGTGLFSESLAGLNSGDRYFYRMWGNNDDGTAAGAELTFLTIPDPPTAFSCTTNNTGLDLAWTNASVGAGSSRYTTVRYKSSGYPTSVTDGTLSYNGTESSHVQMGLTNGVTYYFRAWTFAWDGTDSQYSTDYSQDDGIPATICSVTTIAASSIEETTATASGNVTSTGGMNATTEGIEYGTVTGVYPFDQHTDGSFGVGVFSEALAGLTEGELYYYRAYAINPIGTGYGAEDTFITKPLAPTNFVASVASSSSVSLNWVKGTGADNTLIRYQEDSYPATYTSGSDGYSGTGTSTTITVASGRTWYFRAWSSATEGGKTSYSDSYASATSMPTVGWGIIQIVSLVFIIGIMVFLFILINNAQSMSGIETIVLLLIISILGFIGFIILKNLFGF